MMEPGEASLDLALADIELLLSAYPDETVFAVEEGGSSMDHQEFPLVVTLHLSENALMDLEFNEGYPTTVALKVLRYRSTKDHDRLEEAVKAVQKTAFECLTDGMEGALPCCAAAFTAWNEIDQVEGGVSHVLNAANPSPGVDFNNYAFTWTSGEPLLDRKSSFQAHACRIIAVQDVKAALQQLLSNNKIMRATHNMVREFRKRSSATHTFSHQRRLYPVGLPLYKQKCRWYGVNL
jgi:Uncharacterized protein family UPF0029